MKRPSWILVAGTGRDPLPPELEDTATRLGRPPSVPEGQVEMVSIDVEE